MNYPPLTLRPGPRRHLRCGLRAILVRPQDPLEEHPRPIPRVDLRRRIDALEGLWIDAAAERVAYRRAPGRGIDVDLRLGEIRLQGAQLPDQLLIFHIIDVLIVRRDVDENRDVEILDVI